MRQNTQPPAATIYQAERMGHEAAVLGVSASRNPFDSWFLAVAWAYGHAAAMDDLCEEMVEQAQLAGVPRSFRHGQEAG